MSNFVTQFNCETVNIPNWYVLYTKPKNEKKVAEQLSDFGLEVYCPLVKTMKVWSDRKKKVSEPLFKSYVFIKVTETQRDDAFEAHGVVRYLHWLGKPAVVREEEIEAIRNFLSETEDMTQNLEFEYLQELRVLHGPFKGREAKYLYTNKNKIILQVESLGIVIKAELHHSHVA